jgi:quinate dehydrogenase
MDILKESYRYGASPLASGSADENLQTFLFGKPISHSLSPLIQSTLFKSAPASWTYHLVETTDPADLVAKLNSPQFIGASITMPNKIAFQPFVDEITEEAQVIGAINTIFVRLDRQGRRRHVGANTDCVGVRETLVNGVPGIQKTARDRPAMVIGGGGAARSAIYALWKWIKPSEIYIVNRLKSEVEVIIASFQKTMPTVKLRHVATIAAAQQLQTPYTVVGTIPDYPPREPGEILCWNIIGHFLARDTKGVFVDMCYVPSPITRLFVAARKHGWNVLPGTEIVVRVCIAQQVLWLEREPNQKGYQDALAAIHQVSREAKRILPNEKL